MTTRELIAELEALLLEIEEELGPEEVNAPSWGLFMEESMNPFRDAITKSRLAFDSQGEGDKYGLAWLALAVAADLQDANPQDSLYTDPCEEVLYRWRNYPGFGLQRVADVLAPLIGK